MLVYAYAAEHAETALTKAHKHINTRICVCLCLCYAFSDYSNGQLHYKTAARSNIGTEWKEREKHNQSHEIILDGFCLALIVCSNFSFNWQTTENYSFFSALWALAQPRNDESDEKALQYVCMYCMCICMMCNVHTFIRRYAAFGFG